jgi:hypothetical protein
LHDLGDNRIGSRIGWQIVDQLLGDVPNQFLLRLRSIAVLAVSFLLSFDAPLGVWRVARESCQARSNGRAGLQRGSEIWLDSCQAGRSDITKEFRNLPMPPARSDQNAVLAACSGWHTFCIKRRLRG